MSASGTVVTLASNASATSTFQFSWQGGAGMFSAEATWGGGTVKLQVLTQQSGGATWVDVGPDTTFTANGAAGFILPVNAQIRASIATATAVYAYVVAL